MFTPNILKLNMQTNAISNNFPVICHVRAAVFEIPNAAEPYIPKALQIYEAARFRKNTICKIFARFIVLNILIVFSS